MFPFPGVESTEDGSLNLDNSLTIIIFAPEKITSAFQNRAAYENFVGYKQKTFQSLYRESTVDWTLLHMYLLICVLLGFNMHNPSGSFSQFPSASFPAHPFCVRILILCIIQK